MPKKSGRVSAAEIAAPIAIADEVSRLGDRPEPPISLNERARFEWVRVCDRMPSDWFKDETLSMLQAYCEHVAEGEAIQMMIEQVRPLAMKDDEAYKQYRNLLRDKELQTRAALHGATKMRMTQQSSYNALNSHTAKAKSDNGKKPWQR